MIQNEIPFQLQRGIKSTYGQSIKNILKAEPYQWTFGVSPEKARKTINAKVNKISNGTIKGFLERGS